MKVFDRKNTIKILGSHSKNGTGTHNGDPKSGCQEDARKKRKPSLWERFIEKMKDIRDYVMPIVVSFVGIISCVYDMVHMACNNPHKKKRENYAI